MIRYFLSGITSFSDTPLYITFGAGLIISFGAMFYLFLVVLMWSRGWNIPGWSALMAVVLFLGGGQVLAIGLIGLYVAKIHVEAKDRPRYIVSDTFGFDPNS